MLLISVWIPEVLPNHPGVYAPKDYDTGKNITTTDLQKAITFESHAGCKLWCKSNLSPVFVPVSHGMIEVVDQNNSCVKEGN